MMFLEIKGFFFVYHMLPTGRELSLSKRGCLVLVPCQYLVAYLACEQALRVGGEGGRRMRELARRLLLTLPGQLSKMLVAVILSISVLYKGFSLSPTTLFPK